MPPSQEASIQFLVVGEDDALIRSVRDTLKAGKVGNRVDTAATVDEAARHVESVADGRHNVVVLALPDGITRELAQTFRGDGALLASVPLIGIARDDTGVDEAMGVDGWLTLPFSVAQVLAVLRDVSGFGLTIVRGVPA